MKAVYTITAKFINPKSHLITTLFLKFNVESL